jgi:hypothetical protein
VTGGEALWLDGLLAGADDMLARLRSMAAVMTARDDQFDAYARIRTGQLACIRCRAGRGGCSCPVRCELRGCPAGDGAELTGGELRRAGGG